MGAYASRDAWTTRHPEVAFQLRPREGTALHWLGMAFNGREHSACLRVLHSIEEQDVRDGGFGALPYNEAVCRHGYRIEGRGTARTSGANGSRDVNERYGSVCVLVGVSETLTSAEWAAVHAAVLESARAQAPGRPVLTHSQVRPQPTACPGPDLTAWVRAGCPTSEEDDVSPEECRQIVREELRAVLVEPLVTNDDGTGKIGLATAIYRAMSQARQSEVRTYRICDHFGLATFVPTGRPSGSADVLSP